MKTVLKIIFSFFLLSFVIVGCGQKEETKPADSANQSAETTTAAPEKGSYGVKSGIVTFENVIMEGMNQTFYFDDYGKKEARYTLMEMEMFGQKIRTGSVEINADGYLINYDIEKKEGTKTKSFGSIGGAKDIPADFNSMSKEVLERYNMKDLGTKEILGKTCKGVEMTAMGMVTEVWVWNGIMLYSKVQMSKDAKPMEIKASKIETDVAVPAEKFQVPADVKIKEVTDPMKMGE